ncbi:SDR family oxidoreductase [uncultured Paludibaculum sp.]|uniref:SDR family NAD(P)-dependent oxidoreductase n=1 Tax=uncultured Paludibaculum sp. TaxID=1765020 RepID=UPI002AABB381|nr:SDR family oxidoreductase [uncultured Paludibaculum sp.]
MRNTRVGLNSQDVCKCVSPVALISGGSAGIGAASVRRFLAAGWRVAVVALPDAHLNWLRSQDVVITAGDITSGQTRETTVDRTLAAFGRIDVLINGAGVGLYGLPTEISPPLFSRILNVNVVAPLALAQLVVPVMLEQGFGTIVTMGSVAARVALPWAAAYSASKSALCALHDSLRRELRGSPVHLLNVHPGIVDTNFRSHVLSGQAPDAVRNIRYVVSPEAVAEAIFRAVRRRRKTVYVPAIGFLFNMLGALAPSLMDYYLSRLSPPCWNRIRLHTAAASTTRVE